MLNVKMLKRDENGIFYYGNYHPYRIRGELNPLFDRAFSGMILALKQRERNWKYFFTQLLNDILDDNPNLIIMCVPSHVEWQYGAIEDIIKIVCNNRNMIDGSQLLYRHTTVEKNATSGHRDIQKHMDSIGFAAEEQFETPEELLYFRDKDILIIDDVCTSGNSLLACKKILEMEIPKMKSLTLFAFGKTTY